MPAELVATLRRANVLEAIAGDGRRWHAVIQANSRLMLAAVSTGWQVSEIATVMGLSRHAASKRIQLARRTVDAVELNGIEIPAPPKRPQPVSPLAILYTPIESRDWLSAPEAMKLAGISFGTLTAWRKHGLLPNTRWLNRAQALYARDDLRRVMDSPRTRRGVDRQAVLDRLAAL